MSLRGLIGLTFCLALTAQAETGAAARRSSLGLQLTPSGTALTCGKPMHACEAAWGRTQGYAARLRWQFSPSASASFGVDAYELTGSRERVREASFELQWRY
jgi:hypothetical protein